jgi:hypothetical protein
MESKMENKFFTFIKPYLSFIDNGHLYRKPFSWLYTLKAVVNLILPIYFFLIAQNKLTRNMKNMTTFSMLLFLLGACGHLSDKTSKQGNQNNETNILQDSKEDLADKNIVQSIKDYYQINFGKGARLEEVTNDTINVLTYYNIPNKGDEYGGFLDGFLISITIPLIKNQELFGAIPILEGDVNKDQKKDLVISVHTEGGGGGGNVASQDIFVFVYEKEKYKLVNVTSEGDVCGCNGNFRARKIENNFLVGHSSCYTEDDARCCPSLHYETKVEFENGKLNFVSKKNIK